MPVHCFGSSNTISRFGERFRDGQYSLVSLLFAVLLLTVSPCAQPCLNVVEGHMPHAASGTIVSI